MNDFVDSVPSQKKALTHLEKIYNSKRIPHALLFKGDEGVGKHLAAIEFFKLVNSNQLGADPQVSAKVNSLEEPYVKYIFPLPRGKGESSSDAPLAKLSANEVQSINEEIFKKVSNPYLKISIEKANNIKISSIRDIKKFTSLSYDDLKYRLVLINDADKMNDEAQNALLKSLEEPPPGIIFILISSNPHKLLTTINSRCWHIEFSPLNEEDVLNILLEKFGIDLDESKVILPFCNGSIIKALELIELNFSQMLDSVIQILRFSIVKRFHSAQKQLNDFNKTHSQKAFLELLKLVLNWLVDANENKNNLDISYFNEYKDVFEKFNQKFRKSDINEVFSRIDSLIGLVDKNISLNIISLNAIFELSRLSNR